MIVVTNRMKVAAGYEANFEERFSKRVHLVDQSPGFIRNEVHRPRPMKRDSDSGQWVEDPTKKGCYEVKTWWSSLADFVAWTKSPSFAEAHKNRPPKDMFDGPGKIEIHEVFSSTDVES